MSMTTFILFVALFMQFGALWCEGKEKKVEVCQKDYEKNIRCSDGSAIFIRSSKYGRYKGSSCYQESELDCSIDATDDIRILCSGNASCTIPISNKDLSSKIHCEKRDVSLSLSVMYTCQKYHQTDEECTGHPLSIKPLSGYLLSSYTLQSNKGSSQCPWIFELGASNTLKLSITNFKPQPSNDQTCSKLMQIETSSYNEPVCSNEKERNLTKTDNIIKIILFKNNKLRFAVHYEVIPCPIFMKPDYVREVSSNASEHRLQCIESPDIQFHVKCSQGAWSEFSKRNCTLVETATISPVHKSSSGQTLLILMVVMVALIISIVIIVVGCYCLRTHSFKNEMEASRMDTTSMHHMAKYSSENILDMPPQYNSSTPHYNPSVYSMPIKDPYYLAKRDYATTLQMRQLAGQYPEMVACCPAHGPYSGLMNTIDRQYKTLHMPHHHFQASPSYHHQSTEGALNIPPLTPSGDPFYHELDLFSNLPSPTLNPTTVPQVADVSHEVNDIQTSNST